MYFAKIITVLLVALVSVNSLASESAMKPHAMVYLTIPLDGTDPDQDKFNFGFRLDNVEYIPGKPVNYQQQLQRTAVLDFRMDNKGLDGIYISGTDYVQLYRVLRQNEEEGSEVEVDAEGTAETSTETDAETEVAAEAEAEEDEDDGMTMGDRVRGVIADMRSVAPMGVYMGVALGVGLLLGVDD